MVSQYFPLLGEEGRDVIKSTKSYYLVPWLRYSMGLPLQLYQDKLLMRSLLGLKLSRTQFSCYGGYDKIERAEFNKNKISRKLNKYYGSGSGQDC